MTISVIIVTLNRPDCVRRCLDCLFDQSPRPEQIIVVDASLDDRTRHVVDEFPSVVYLRNDNGYGRMTASRNIGLKISTGEIIAFLDDDAFAHPGWLESLAAAYTDDTVGAVGGRALNNVPGESEAGVHHIGKLKSNGVLCANFAADPGKIIEVDHILGANMSFRREVLARLGGFREDYPGISGICEDSDMCLRVKALGYRMLFNPRACVDHVAAPQAKGQRFDTRYLFYHRRNNLVLFLRNFGFGPLALRYLAFIIWQSLVEFVKKLGGAFARLGASMAGTVAGIFYGVLILVTQGRNPVRQGSQAQELTLALRSAASKERDHAAS